MAKKFKGKKKKKKSASKAEKDQLGMQRKLYRDFRTFMRELGFSHLKVDGTEIVVGGRTGELDDIFIYKNILVLAEYTIGKPNSAHILKKKPLFDRIQSDIPDFLEVAREKYAQFVDHLDQVYDDSHFYVRILYVPLLEAAEETINAASGVVFFARRTQEVLLRTRQNHSEFGACRVFQLPKSELG